MGRKRWAGRDADRHTQTIIQVALNQLIQNQNNGRDFW
jgi:hypothetical protein